MNKQADKGEIMNFLKSAMNKILGGRWYITVVIITTYCYLMIRAVDMVKDKLLGVDGFLGMFTAFALLAKEIQQAYFVRQDRGEESKTTVTKTEKTEVTP